jgi:hypothetical protein
MDWWSKLATVIAAIVAIIAVVVGGFQYLSTSNQQSEDAAYRVVEDHMKLRVDTPELNELLREVRVNPEHLSDENEVSAPEYDHYRDLAIHGLTTAEHIYNTRGEDEGWKSTAEGWVREYEAAILYGTFICEDYGDEFVDFVGDTLKRDLAEFCVSRDEHLEGLEEARNRVDPSKQNELPFSGG